MKSPEEKLAILKLGTKGLCESIKKLYELEALKRTQLEISTANKEIEQKAADLEVLMEQL